MQFLKNIEKYTLLNTIPHELFQDYLSRKILKVSVYKKGQVIHFDGDKCSCLEVILEGKVVIERIGENGDLFTITEFYPDDILGGNLIFSRNPYYPMTISARTDVEILEIEKEILFELCCNNREFLYEFLQLISGNALILGDKIKHYANRSIRDSICAYLKNEYYLQNTYKIRLNTTKKALAERIGIQRTSLSRELQKMKKEGLIVYDATSITIIDEKIIQ
ncbi:cAMP-binding domain of CRP or a regulatory subunit of cAMP-dependent protein kinases [Natronincola peptidivorans]|uniref:cAMP-binding domain of CRP or a regulatory subunit of cAMP-dependent protein kinases n=1 Tax=Natronincola peptidivorans TaxID=426128 RepID=A0A1I0C603_9FIRM|nr:cAMP-binding domain of CRP or a regulatory subunit of cAMP-dependent protein kinases [Natronincola peptidivorans]